MRKRIFTLFLVAVMCIDMFPITALATQNTSESEPVYLGTETEYQSTLDTMFDENGLRKVTVGYNSNDGELYNKVGLVDKYGKFVVQPIYDDIVDAADYVTSNGGTTLPSYFVGGYTQAVRDGKMGLINVNGEEVVPCQYDYVGLPSEGICRVYRFKEKNGVNNIFYLGYWSLEQNKEIVAPDKYVTPFTSNYLYDYESNMSWKKPAGDGLCVHDFIDGYALVFTESGITDNEISDYRKSTVIDKNGKDILGKAYITAVALLSVNYYQDYPQKGPYMSFIQRNVTPSKYKDTAVYKAWKKQSDIKKGFVKFGASDFTGLVGSEGILIPAEYTSCHYLSSADTDGDGLYETGVVSFGSATFQIIPDKKLVITSNAINTKIDKYAPAIANCYGVINFSGKAVVPFGKQEQYVSYNDEYQIFALAGKIYNAKGKVISKRTYDMISANFVNGYELACTFTGKYNQKNNAYATTWYIVKPDGTEVNLTKALGLGKYENDFEGISDFNTKGYFWLKRNGGKWTLINSKGKTVLSTKYDNVNTDEWANGKKGYAIVTKNSKSGIVSNAGKQIVSCSYESFTDYSRYADPYYGEKQSSVIAMKGKNGYGLINITSGKVVLPAKYDSVWAYNTLGQRNLNYFEMGSYYVELGDKRFLLDKDGNEVFSTSKKFFEAVNGLYSYNDNTGHFDNRGRIIIPGELEKVTNFELGDSYTIYVKDSKVYRISANYLDITYKYKSISSSEEEKEKVEAYAQSQQEAHKNAYEQAINNPYQQKPIYQKAFVSFRSVPDKVTYKVGEAFETAGFKAVYVDVYGNETDISSEITFDVNGVKIYDGYKFTTAANKTVNCSYKGEKLNTFKITVLSSDAKYLADGNYYITVYGKYFTVVDGRYLELSDKKPSKPFTVKLLYVDEDGYFIYKMMYDGGYVYQPSSSDGAQLMVSTSSGALHQWRIAKYADFCTIRDAGKQSLLVNASGASSANGTKVIISTKKGSAPDNAKLTFVPAS